jgi:hypothetical protein
MPVCAKSRGRMLVSVLCWRQPPLRESRAVLLPLPSVSIHSPAASLVRTASNPRAHFWTKHAMSRKLMELDPLDSLEYQVDE